MLESKEIYVDAMRWRREASKTLATLLIAGNGIALLTMINVASAIPVAESVPRSYPAWIVLLGVVAGFVLIVSQAWEQAEIMNLLTGDRKAYPNTVAISIASSISGLCFVLGTGSALLEFWP